MWIEPYIDEVKRNIPDSQLGDRVELTEDYRLVSGMALSKGVRGNLYTGMLPAELSV